MFEVEVELEVPGWVLLLPLPPPPAGHRVFLKLGNLGGILTGLVWTWKRNLQQLYGRCVVVGVKAL